ncbi:hypothetical protein FQN53_005311 [Emmonsiellopsis sp. PD_33]|nr:hypothetical protein FQN53_005311 [Emmonsiellopsis sp. PD_33]
MSTTSSSPTILTPDHSPTSPEADARDADHVVDRSKHDSISAPRPTPRIRLQLDDVSHPGTEVFLHSIRHLNELFEDALQNIVDYLYTSPSNNNDPDSSSGPINNTPLSPHRHKHKDNLPLRTFTPTLPSTHAVTLILRTKPGVAYTIGNAQDNDLKEIHFSLTYIASVGKTNSHPRDEITGVITHELVHCYQHTPSNDHTSLPAAPGGLVEGIADFVRLSAGLDPPHWNKPRSSGERGERWDAGYQVTAYFLEWIEKEKVGEGAVGRVNDRILRTGYTADFWTGLFGVDVGKLWEEYGQYLDGED